MTSAKNNSKSSKELKREVNKEINNVDNDLKTMEAKLTPGQIIDDLIFNQYEGSVRDMAAHLKDHPIGSSFLAAGTMLLSRDESLTSKARGKLSEVSDKVSERTTGTKEQAKAKTSQVKGKVQSKVQHGVEQGKEQIKDHSLSFMAFGFGLGALTGGSIPIGQKESELVDKNLSGRLSHFSEDLDHAIKESANIFKQELMHDLRP